MTIRPNSAAPYAPPSAVLGVIDRARDRGLPNPVTKDVLLRAGVSESLVPRTLQSLQLLELIDSDGAWTENLEILRKAPEAEFSNRLAEIIRAVYADVFQYIDPAQDAATQIRDAFRSYTPHGQQDRMVVLFMRLCQRAGLAPEGTPEKTGTQTRIVRKVVSVKPKARQQTHAYPSQQPAIQQAASGIHPALAGLLSTLPQDGWAQKADRDRFIAALIAMLDYCVPVRAQSEDDDLSMREDNEEQQS